MSREPNAKNDPLVPLAMAFWTSREALPSDLPEQTFETSQGFVPILVRGCVEPGSTCAFNIAVPNGSNGKREGSLGWHFAAPAIFTVLPPIATPPGRARNRIFKVYLCGPLLHKQEEEARFETGTVGDREKLFGPNQACSFPKRIRKSCKALWVLL